MDYLNDYDDWRALDEDEHAHHLDYLCPECDCEMEPCLVGADGTCPNPECDRVVDLFLVDRETGCVVDSADSAHWALVLSHECDSDDIVASLVRQACAGREVDMGEGYGAYLCDIGGVPLVGPVRLPAGMTDTDIQF